AAGVDALRQSGGSAAAVATAAAAACRVPTESEVHQLRARQRAASILNLSDGELDSLLMASGSPQQQQQQPTKTKLAELRTAMGSRETTSNGPISACGWRRLSSSPNTSSPAELDQLLDKFTEKLDDFVNTHGSFTQSPATAHRCPRRHHRYSPALQCEQQSIVGDHRAAQGVPLRAAAVGCFELRRPPAVKAGRVGEVLAQGGWRSRAVALFSARSRPGGEIEGAFVRRQLRIWEGPASSKLRILAGRGSSNLRILARLWPSNLRIWERASSNWDRGRPQQQLRIWRPAAATEDLGGRPAATEDLGEAGSSKLRILREAGKQPQTHQSPPHLLPRGRQCGLQACQPPHFFQRLACKA
uniref:CDCA2 n=1 Tax=Macrostomum lignano TaxID=282301 RepID=A0A1I8FP91_9PLAT